MVCVPAQQPIVAKRASRGLTDVLFAASVVFIQVIAAIAAVIFVIKKAHSVVSIKEGLVRLR